MKRKVHNLEHRNLWGIVTNPDFGRFSLYGLMRLLKIRGEVHINEEEIEKRSWENEDKLFPRVYL